jgi:hypothetical protein
MSAFRSPRCLRCRRPLSNPTSQINGFGPICWSIVQAQNQRHEQNQGGMIVDLPYDPLVMDIRCERREFEDGHTQIHVNIPQRVVHHSPDGFEWGYGGSGPADFALNILDLFVPATGKDDRVECYQGTCSQFAWDWHQDFKRQFIASLPREGGIIHGDTIRSYIAIVRGGQLMRQFLQIGVQL